MVLLVGSNSGKFEMTQVSGGEEFACFCESESGHAQRVRVMMDVIHTQVHTPLRSGVLEGECKPTLRLRGLLSMGWVSVSSGGLWGSAGSQTKRNRHVLSKKAWERGEMDTFFSFATCSVSDMVVADDVVRNHFGAASKEEYSRKKFPRPDV